MISILLRLAKGGVCRGLRRLPSWQHHSEHFWTGRPWNVAGPQEKHRLKEHENTETKRKSAARHCARHRFEIYIVLLDSASVISEYHRRGRMVESDQHDTPPFAKTPKVLTHVRPRLPGAHHRPSWGVEISGRESRARRERALGDALSISFEGSWARKDPQTSPRKLRFGTTANPIDCFSSSTKDADAEPSRI